MGIGQSHATSINEFHNDFATTDVRVKMRDNASGVVSRDRTKPDLAYPFAAHTCTIV